MKPVRESTLQTGRSCVELSEERGVVLFPHVRYCQTMWPFSSLACVVHCFLAGTIDYCPIGQGRLPARSHAFTISPLKIENFGGVSEGKTGWTGHGQNSKIHAQRAQQAMAREGGQSGRNKTCSARDRPSHTSTLVEGTHMSSPLAAKTTWEGLSQLTPAMGDHISIFSFPKLAEI